MLHHKKPHRVATDHRARARIEHPPPKVAIASANIQNTTVRQVNVVRQAGPFEITPPLGVNVNAGHAPWAFSPRHQALKNRLNNTGIITGCANVNRAVVNSPPRFDGRQPIEQCTPIGVSPVARQPSVVKRLLAGH
jgi:hypothetical protein